MAERVRRRDFGKNSSTGCFIVLTSKQIASFQQRSESFARDVLLLLANKGLFASVSHLGLLKDVLPHDADCRDRSFDKTRSFNRGLAAKSPRSHAKMASRLLRPR